MKRIIASLNKRKIYLIDNGIILKELAPLWYGKNGGTKNKCENDMCTPLGVFNLGFAFGKAKLKINYPYYLIKDNIYWVDDPESSYYNNWVEVTSKKREFLYPYMKTSKDIVWQKAEHLINYPVGYELALVIEYNTKPVIKNAGSAIFLHIKEKDYTAGCLATTKANMEDILNWLDGSSKTVKIEIRLD